MAFHLRIAYIVLLSTLTFEVNSPWWSSFCYDILFCVTDDLCNLIRAIKKKNCQIEVYRTVFWPSPDWSIWRIRKNPDKRPNLAKKKFTERALILSVQGRPSYEASNDVFILTFGDYSKKLDLG